MCRKHHESDGSSSVEKAFRLPKNIVPTNYVIELTPDLEKFTFSGTVAIEVDVLSPAAEVKINAKELEISEFYAVNAGETRHNGVVSIDHDTEIATISFQGKLGAGKWVLHSTFTGILNDKLKGFYRSIWTDAQGKKHTIATTQFESTDARRAFPCFDEPEFKATFDVTLIVPAELTALSNGAITSTTPVDGGKKRVTYERTMKMSTYLVCFCIGEFVSSQPVLVNGIEVRIWAVPGREHMMSFPLAAAAYATDHYEKYFEIPYPGGKKIDHIAIPDFASGAMENLGLITYRETSLLLDEKTATHAERNRVAVVVLHELAHMWFGDLVTMAWWNGLWLNESFATFMENLCLSHWKPEWHIWDEFGLSRAAASRVDALRSTHPIESPVNHPDDAKELFDVISYEKGCSVLYQLHQFIGAENFRRGISAYLKKHSYGNTETHDLWDALEEACKQADPVHPIPVRKIMDAWVFTAGHPVVEVATSDMAGFVKLSQRPFKFLPDGATTLWPVPITMRIKGKDGVSEKKFLLEEAEQTVYVGEDYDWVVVNSGGSGFYRVSYDKALAAKLATKVQENLSAIERFNLVNDSWACVKAGLISTTDYLEMVKLFASEEDPNVWAIVLGSLSTLHSLVKDETGNPYRSNLQQIVRDLVSPTLNRLTFTPAEGESVHTRQLRGTLMGTLGTIGEDAAVQAKAVELFNSWKADKQSVDANIVPAIVSILAYKGDQNRYDEFHNISRTATSPQEVQRFLFALARFRDEKLLDSTIAKCLTDDVRTQDAPSLFATVLMNEVAAANAWKFLKDNWQTMVARYPENGVVRMVGAVTGLDTPELEAEVKDFFAKNPVKAGEMATAQALEQLRINVAMRERETGRLQAHLLKAVAPAAVPVAAGAPGSDKK
ncbi:MAG: M1 family metallopeptidase [Cyanobacteria bacterium SZAS TMP-1]|nr:M1 family metallopeptidase [Cyanobacteria bacterium SZAS TMP-1]